MRREVPEEVSTLYPKRGCRFVKRNLPTACYERVTKMEQLCKIFTAEDFAPDWRSSPPRQAFQRTT
jgi:hypothetical protein